MSRSSRSKVSSTDARNTDARHTDARNTDGTPTAHRRPAHRRPGTPANRPTAVHSSFVWEGPGFVDHHVHLLAVAAGMRPPWGTTRDPEAIARWHSDVFARGSSPVDEPPTPIGATDLEASLHAGLQSAASLGLVEVTEAGLSDLAVLEALHRLRERGPLPVRVRILIAAGRAEGGMPSRTGDPWLDVTGVKFYADGWLVPRTCALRQPFDDRPGHAGLLFQDAETLARRAAPFADHGWTIATHAIGDRAVEAALDAYEAIWGSDCRAAAPRIEHAQVLAPDLVARMGDLGVVVCIQPGFAHSDAPSARVALGERASHAYAWDRLLAAGVRLVVGSDHPIEDLSPLEGLGRLVTQAPIGTAMEREQALAIATDASAGTTVLSDDPLVASLETLVVLAARPAG